MAIQNSPDPSKLCKLGELRRDLAAELLEKLGWLNHYILWECDCPTLLDVAYERKRLRLSSEDWELMLPPSRVEEFPRKVEHPAIVEGTREEMSRIVDQIEGLGKSHPVVVSRTPIEGGYIENVEFVPPGPKEFAEIDRLAVKIYELERVFALKDFIKVAALRGQLQSIRWLLSNFGFDAETIFETFTSACSRGKLLAAKLIYNTSADRLDWKAYLEGRRKVRYLPFVLSLFGDYAQVAAWLLGLADFSKYVRVPYSHYLFDGLLILNNVAGVRWLLEKYNVPWNAFFRSRREEAAIMMALRNTKGREAMWEYLSSKYKIVGSTGVLKGYLLPLLREPPPPTPRLSEVPERVSNAVWHFAREMGDLQMKENG